MHDICTRLAVAFLAILLPCCFVPLALAQTESATIAGRVSDPSGAIIPGATLRLVNIDKGTETDAKTNSSGVYVLPGIQPGRYRIQVERDGFKVANLVGLTVNVQDNLEENFRLEVGSVSESITVSAGENNINTTDASVSTVVDRQFVENMPLNGRSFQDLEILAPGVVQVQSSGAGWSGEITVNGQRSEGNYFTVDGVSGNIGTSITNSFEGAGFAGNLPGETMLGTTQSLVSVDALQEFRASTSTYSAEFGRSPGGQFSFTTRSGTNTLHGSAYDYLRNNAFDANNWFNNHAIPRVARQAERQNDFGGTLGGPVTIPRFYSGKDRTFFFFSYEGLRLVVPYAVQQYSVPDLCFRGQTSQCASGDTAAPADLQPFLNAFPIANGPEDGLNDGLALYNLAYSAPDSLDSIGLRIDHSFGDRLKLFGRYAYTPSSGWSLSHAAGKSSEAVSVQGITLGATNSFTNTQANELRFNITQNDMHESITNTTYGGATPLDYTNIPGPNGESLPTQGSDFGFLLLFGGEPELIFQDTRSSLINA